MTQFWIQHKGRARGPFSPEDIQGFVQSGKLTASHRVSTDRETWLTVKDWLAEHGSELSPAATPVAGESLDAPVRPTGSLNSGTHREESNHATLEPKPGWAVGGIALLILLTLVVAVSGIRVFGLGPGLVSTLLFGLVAALGLGAVLLGGSATAIYVLVASALGMLAFQDSGWYSLGDAEQTTGGGYFGMSVWLTLTAVVLILAALGLAIVTIWFRKSRWIGAVEQFLICAAAGAFVLRMMVVGTNTPLKFWGLFIVGTVPALLLAAAWWLIARGRGLDFGMATDVVLSVARKPLRRVSANDAHLAAATAMAAAGGVTLADMPRRVKLQLDPDDLFRSEDSLGEVLQEEAKRGAPAFGVSLAFHALLLIALVFFHVRSTSEPPFVLDGALISEAERTAVVKPEEKPSTSPIKLQTFPLDPNRQPEREDDPVLTPVGKPQGQPAAVSTANLNGLLDDRGEDNRRKTLLQFEQGQQIEQAVWTGLGWLQRHQLDAGNWQLHDGYPNAGQRVLKSDTGATALALLCFLGHGQTHLSAKNPTIQETVRKGLDWLQSVQKENGDFHDWDELGRQTAFYSHAQAVIVFCEAYTLTRDRALLDPARKGVRYLLASQQPTQGGWKYQPQNATSVGDLSVTGWALMALHAARNAGISVPSEAFERAQHFLDEVQSAGGARYKYEPRPGWDATLAMTAEGLLCRQYFGWQPGHPPLEEGVDWLLAEENLPRWENGRRNVYQWYYTAQTLHNLNDERFKEWYRHTAELLVNSQGKAGLKLRGSWHPTNPRGAPYEYGDKAGRLYVTCMCLLTLQTPYRHRALGE